VPGATKKTLESNKKGDVKRYMRLGEGVGGKSVTKPLRNFLNLGIADVRGEIIKKGVVYF